MTGKLNSCGKITSRYFTRVSYETVRWLLHIRGTGRNKIKQTRALPTSSRAVVLYARLGVCYKWVNILWQVFGLKFVVLCNTVLSKKKPLYNLMYIYIYIYIVMSMQVIIRIYRLNWNQEYSALSPHTVFMRFVRFSRIARAVPVNVPYWSVFVIEAKCVLCEVYEFINYRRCIKLFLCLTRSVAPVSYCSWILE